MPFTRVRLAALALACCPAFGGPGRLAFQPAGKGLFAFDTGQLKGRLKLDGRYQGLHPLVHVATGAQLVHPPGIFSFYRVFETNRRYGNGARDWPTEPRLRPDGAVTVHWPPAKGHPVDFTATYRWTAPDTLDLDVAVKPQRDMPRFELFMSSYFTRGFRASVYMKRPDAGDGKPRFVPADRRPGSRGGYVMFPRDEEAVRTIQDGRWKIPPSPVNWAIERWLAAPLALRRNQALGLTAVMMCRPGDCFAVASPWNPPSPKGGGYRSLYHSLFGRDLKAGETAHARLRLVIASKLTDERAVQLYKAFLMETQR